MRIEFGKETAQAGIIEGCWIPLKQTRDHTGPWCGLVRTRTEQAGEGAAQAAADRKHACFARPEEKQRCLSVSARRIPFASRSFYAEGGFAGMAAWPLSRSPPSVFSFSQGEGHETH
jgi:hypothetical protein